MKLSAIRPGSGLACLAFILGCFGGGVVAATVPDYQVGDSAGATVTTPVGLRFIDPDATEAARAAKAQTVLPFFRFLSGASNSVETAFRREFSKTREAFLQAVVAEHGKPRFGRQEISDEALGRIRSGFPRSNAGLPVTAELARAWVSGDDGLALENRWSDLLRRATAKVIRPSGTWAGSDVTAKDVRLLPVASFDETVSLYDAERNCRLFRRSTMVPLNRARQELEDSFPPAELQVAKYLAGLVQPNCDFDAELTQQAASPRTNDVWVYDRIEAGGTVVAAGQIVDARTKAALDELRKNTAVTVASSAVAQAEAEIQSVRSNAAESAESAARLGEEIERVRAEAADRQRALLRWSGIGFCVLGLAAARLWWKLVKGRPRSGRAMAPALKPKPLAAPLTTMPYAMRRRLHERGTLLACQQQAEKEIDRFSERLMELHLPAGERLKAYEDRIADLERQLSSRTEENRELISAAIESTRRKLEAERSARAAESNN
jgi:hypothetical protein